MRWVCAHRYGSQLMIVFNTFAQFDTLLSGVLLALVLGWDRDRPGLTRWLRWLQWPLYVVIGWVMSQPHLGHGTHLASDLGLRLGLAVRSGDRDGRGLGEGLAPGRAVVLPARLAGQDQLRALHVPRDRALDRASGSTTRLPWFPNKDELLAIATLALTIALAAASYYGYERRFLVLKRAWTRVPSRPV